MAEEIQAPEDEQEFAQWLDELESEEDKAVAVAEREDKQAQKPVQANKAQRDDEAVVTRTEYLTDKFLATASDQEKALFAIYSHGVETPREMQSAIDLAKTNAAEAAKVMGEEVEEKAEEKAKELAKSEYGVGPISGGSSSDLTPEEQQKVDLWGKVQKDGDPGALLTLMAEDSDFIDAVIYGKPLRKKAE
jgi:hypothetical protein